MFPFHAAMIVALILITYIPWLTLVVPRLFGYQG
jgi:TRAP-type C4-dicarboxylate transport system permease large subunit